MSELEQRRRNVRVLDLLTESYEAHENGDEAASNAAMDRALEIDAGLVSIILGAMIIGEIPNPDRNWPGWAEYVTANRDALADLEAAQ